MTRIGAQRSRSIGVSRRWLDPRPDSQVSKCACGVSFPPQHVGNLLRNIGGSRHKPRERASQRNEVAIAPGQSQHWPELKKKARQAKRTRVFVDEAGLYLLAAAVRTWDPKGQTPIVTYPFGEHLSVIRAIPPAGQRSTMIQDKSFSGGEIVRFLNHLLGHITGTLLVIWDGLPAHRSQPINDFVRDGAAQRLHRERWPRYAPDLNPDEGVWQYLQQVELAHMCCHDGAELRQQLRRAIARLRRKTHIIQSFLGRARLEPVV